MIRQRFISLAASAMSVASASLVIAFVRQLLIAAYFGASRALAVYLFAYAVANWVGFAFGIAFDSISIMHLVKSREVDGADGSGALGRAAFRASGVMGLLAALLMVTATFVLTPIIASGFTSAERASLIRLSWYFVPWIAVLIPYYAVAARHKSEWRFKRVFIAEIIVGLTSVAWLVALHGSIRQLPAAYCAGYAAALAFLVPGAGLFGRADGTKLRPLLRDIAELYVANQTGNVPGIADRHFQSLVPGGGIAAIGYASQLLMGLSSLIGMREIFIVPLSEAERRDERMERLIAGMLLLAVPIAGGVACFAPEIVRILFERGRFSAADATLTAGVLRILALSLAVTAVTTPLARMLQIVRRIRLIHIYYMALAVFVTAGGSVFVGWLDLGARGIALMNLSAGIPGVAVLAVLVARCGVKIRWRRIGRFLLFAAIVSGIAAALALGAASLVAGTWPRLLAGGPVYGLVVTLAYLAARRRLIAAMTA